MARKGLGTIFAGRRPSGCSGVSAWLPFAGRLTLGLVFTGKVYLLLPLSGGFFIVAPLLVAGLYDTSRRLELGQQPTLATALLAWRAPGLP